MSKPKLTRQLMIDNLLGYHGNLTPDVVESWSFKRLWSYCHPIFREAYSELFHKMMEEEEESDLTYDVVFNDDEDSNNKGFDTTIDNCKDHIACWNGTNYSYFKDYKGGVVSIVCNETGETVYEEEVV